MSSKYVDTISIMQVIGTVYNDNSLLDDTDKYTITDEDFPDMFHRIVFGALFKLHELGTVEISLENINDFLASRPKSEAVYRQNKGDEWVLKAAAAATPLAFDYYYSRMKKMTLLRAYDSYGVDVSGIYDPDNILDVKKKQYQEEQLDNSSLEDIANIIDDRIESIKLRYVDDVYEDSYQAGDGILDLIDDLKKHPEVGVPMYGPLINAVTRGARLRKFYLRSAATGVGKSRSMIADACYFSCGRIYDMNLGWINTGFRKPTLYITTEQDKSEIQTMMLAFISEVNEDHILSGKYEGDEEERVKEAARILADAPLYIDELPDFSLKDVEDRIRKGIRDHGILYCVHDYVHTSMKILEEITKKSGGVKLREDNILFMLSNKLKDLCNKYGIFILSGTQLNGNYAEADTPDQNLLRGAKAIADKIDFGAILLSVKDEDLVALEPVLSNHTFEKPNMKISVYKNRRGKYKGIYLWAKADLGTCRIKPMFATDYSYEMIEIEDMKIKVEPESAF